MTSSISRRRRKAMQKEAPADTTIQGLKITALERAVEHLVKMSQDNHKEIIRAFAMTDAHLWVLKAICCDIVSGEVKRKDDNANEIDLASYYAQFNEVANQRMQEMHEASEEDHESEESGEGLGAGESPSEVVSAERDQTNTLSEM